LAGNHFGSGEFCDGDDMEDVGLGNPRQDGKKIKARTGVSDPGYKNPDLAYLVAAVVVAAAGFAAGVFFLTHSLYSARGMKRREALLMQ